MTDRDRQAETDRDTHTDTDRHRHQQRQTDRQTGKDRQRQTSRDRQRHIDRHRQTQAHCESRSVDRVSTAVLNVGNTTCHFVISTPRPTDTSRLV